MLQSVAVGEDVWVDLFGHVLHQETIYEASIALAAWMVDALLTQKLGGRMIPVGKPFGKKVEVNERSIALDLLSGMAESAQQALGSRNTPKQYAAIAALVLEVLRPGIPLYEAGVEDADERTSEVCSVLLAALADGRVAAPIDSNYQRGLREKLGMPSA